MQLELYFDGGSRGNPGPAGYGAVIFDVYNNEKIVETYGFLGERTNNYAEYSGLIAGLELAHKINPLANINVYADSKLVVEQMSGRWKIKDEILAKLAQRAYNLFPHFNVKYTWIPREKNKIADELANKAMDNEDTETIWNSRYKDNVENKNDNTALFVQKNENSFDKKQITEQEEEIKLTFVNIDDKNITKTRIFYIVNFLEKYGIYNPDLIISNYFDKKINEEIKSFYNVDVAICESVDILEEKYENIEINKKKNILIFDNCKNNGKKIEVYVKPLLAKYIPVSDSIDVIGITSSSKKNIIYCLGAKIY